MTVLPNEREMELADGKETYTKKKSLKKDSRRCIPVKCFGKSS
jgi:hypothetical protein